MKIQHVTVCGVGELGTQIAFQIASRKFKVVVFDLNQQILDNAKIKFIAFGEKYKKDLKDASIDFDEVDIQEAIDSISYSTKLAEATKDADLIIEAIPENLEMKKDFYAELNQVAPEKSIFCTSSSTMLPSQLISDTKRATRLLALHCSFGIWNCNIAEIRRHEGTDAKVFDEVIAFAKTIDMVPLPIYKEQGGYIFNTLILPVLKAAQSLYINNISDPQTIDKIWMLATGSPIGPFGIYDIIGIEKAYDMIKMSVDNDYEDSALLLDFLQENFINKGKLGIATGEGFYTYPNPIYQNEDFLN